MCRTEVCTGKVWAGHVCLKEGFAEFDKVNKIWSGFDVELCRAIAAALFDGVEHVVFTDLPAAQRLWSGLNAWRCSNR